MRTDIQGLLFPDEVDAFVAFAEAEGWAYCPALGPEEFQLFKDQAQLMFWRIMDNKIATYSDAGIRLVKDFRGWLE